MGVSGALKGLSDLAHQVRENGIFCYNLLVSIYLVKYAFASLSSLVMQIISVVLVVSNVVLFAIQMQVREYVKSEVKQWVRKRRNIENVGLAFTSHEHFTIAILISLPITLVQIGILILIQGNMRFYLMGLYLFLIAYLFSTGYSGRKIIHKIIPKSKSRILKSAYRRSYKKLLR